MGVMMTELQTSIPGDIPGLLRRGSPIVGVGPDRHRRGWVGLIEQAHSDGQARIAWNAGVHGIERIASVALDLTDPTGRAHAAWWSVARLGDPGIKPEAWFEARQICNPAEMNRAMTPAQIDTLARLVLRLAGRS